MFTYNIAKLRWVTIFGAGLLVGTALIVIIPEGVAMHYESQMKHDHSPAVTHLPPGVKVAPSGIEELSDDQGGEAPPAAAAAHAHEALDHSGHGHRRVLLSSQQQQAEAGAEALGAAVSSFVDSLSSGVSAAVRSARGLSAVADDNAAASSSQQQHGRSLRRKKGGRKDSGSSSGGEGSGTNAADIGAVAAAAEEPEEHDEGDETTVVTEPPGAHAGTTGDASAPAGGAGAEEDDSYHGSAHGGHAHGVGGGAGGAGGGVDGHQHPGHWQIGAALALGFAFQVIVGAWPLRKTNSCAHCVFYRGRLWRDSAFGRLPSETTHCSSHVQPFSPSPTPAPSAHPPQTSWQGAYTATADPTTTATATGARCLPVGASLASPAAARTAVRTRRRRCSPRYPC